MRALRRPDFDARIEIMPLIDVVFLLLTFFIYAMVLMIRAELLPIEMVELSSGQTATMDPAVTISLDRNGRLFVDREPVEIDAVVPRLRDIVDRDPTTVIYLAAEETGDTDRLPTFLRLYDRLAGADLDIKLVGRPTDTSPPRPTASNMP